MEVSLQDDLRLNYPYFWCVYHDFLNTFTVIHFIAIFLPSNTLAIYSILALSWWEHDTLQFFHFPSFLKTYILASMLSCLMLTSLISKSFFKNCKMRCVIRRKFVARFHRDEKEKESNGQDKERFWGFKSIKISPVETLRD